MNKSLWNTVTRRVRRVQCGRSSLKRCPSLPLRILAICAVLLAFCAVANSQTATGQFNGHVFDQNGAVVPGATVTLLDAQTNLSRSTQTNGEGLYQFPLLPPGAYKISVTQNGFDTATSQEFRLEVNQVATQDFKLQVGATSQTVTVSSSSELLQASTANLGAVVEQRAVNDLPLNGRSFSALLTLAPGVNPVNQSQNKSGVSYGTPFRMTTLIFH